MNCFSFLKMQFAIILKKLHLFNLILLLQIYSRGGKTFSIKSQRVNILGFADHMFFVATTQFCMVALTAELGRHV